MTIGIIGQIIDYNGVFVIPKNRIMHCADMAQTLGVWAFLMMMLSKQEQESEIGRQIADK